jgi:hypothetical protein
MAGLIESESHRAGRALSRKYEERFAAYVDSLVGVIAKPLRDIARGF